MITTYLLQDCKYCKQLLSYIKKNPNVNILLICMMNNLTNNKTTLSLMNGDFVITKLCLYETSQ